jgi:hypothetical protein
MLVFLFHVLTQGCEATLATSKYHRKQIDGGVLGPAGAIAFRTEADVRKQHSLSASASIKKSSSSKSSSADSGSRSGSRSGNGSNGSSSKSSRIGRRSNPALDGLLATELASPLSYNATLLNTLGFTQAGCGKGDFLVADTGMVDRWICATEGEQLVTAAIDKILSAGCRSRNGRPSDALFLDIGSNSGFHGLNAISHGCVAAFFDIQPGCNKVVNAALLVNGFTDRGVVMAAGLSDRDGVVPPFQRFLLRVLSSCLGFWGGIQAHSAAQ